MLPNVFELLAGSSDVIALIGTDPVRAYRHGDAPQNVAVPYVAWSVVSGIPENQLDGTPKIDNFSVQLDCWSEGDEEVDDLATAVRDAIEPENYLTSISPDNRDPETMRYRISLIFTFWTHRP
jgi:hypothetical protein